ncbi:MAG: putative quinol monooxygenase [Nitrospinales bacterium]
MSDRLYVTARFTAKADRVEDMIELLTALATKTRDESGCVDYGYYQSSDAPSEFTSIETWDGAESEAAHWETEHLKEALSRLPELMDGEVEITKYSKVA